MPSPPEYPRIIKHGSVVVKVYRAKHKTTETGWTYVLAWVSGRRRRRQQFAKESEAMEEGRLKAAQLADGQTEVAEMTRSDRADLIAARDLCGDVPLLSALEEWRKAREAAGANRSL